MPSDWIAPGQPVAPITPPQVALPLANVPPANLPPTTPLPPLPQMAPPIALPVTIRKSRAVGIIALSLSVSVTICVVVLILIFAYAITRSRYTYFYLFAIVGALSFVALIAFTLAIIAISLNRGRLFGIMAICLPVLADFAGSIYTVASNSSLHH